MLFKSTEAGLTLPPWISILLGSLEPAALAALQTFIGELIAGLPTTPPTTFPGWLAALVADLKPASLQAVQVFIATLLGNGPAPAPASPPSA